jgi:hypothetical protein
LFALLLLLLVLRLATLEMAVADAWHGVPG